MSAELDQPGMHEAAGPGATGVEPGVGSVAVDRVVVRHPDGSQMSSLDANHDGTVTMSEIAPPRPEDGHDIVNAVIAEGVLAGALVLTAAYMGVQRLRGRRQPGQA